MLASARAGNVIGGGDFSENRIIPDIIRSIEKNQTVKLRSPQSTRPWQHVLDPIFGYMILAMKLFNEGEKFATAYNFGPDKNSSITVKSVTQTFIDKIGQGSYEDTNNNEFHEAKTLRLDNSKARKELDWKPVLDPIEAIDFTSSWYENYLHNKDTIKDFTNHQIEYFSNKI
jgi:CDP-glucose 4,6-dehydratase